MRKPKHRPEFVTKAQLRNAIEYWKQRASLAYDAQRRAEQLAMENKRLSDRIVHVLQREAMKRQRENTGEHEISKNRSIAHYDYQRPEWETRTTYSSPGDRSA